MNYGDVQVQPMDDLPPSMGGKGKPLSAAGQIADRLIAEFLVSVDRVWQLDLPVSEYATNGDLERFAMNLRSRLKARGREAEVSVHKRLGLLYLLDLRCAAKVEVGP